jgi:hypothetical protein
MIVWTDSQLTGDISAELQPGERLLWCGKPAPARVMLRDGARLLGTLGSIIAVVVMIGVFSLFIRDMGPSSRTNDPFGFGLFNTIFGLVVVIIILASAAPLLNDYLRAGRQVYAVTDQRLMIVTLPALWWGHSIQSFTPQEIQALTRRMHGNGTGDVIFSSESYRVRRKYGYSTRTRDVGFFGIPDAREVEQLIIRTFQQEAN